MKTQLLSLLLVGFSFGAFAQNVGIGTTNFTAHPSSVLELKSTTSGFLMPRMTVAQRDAISSPAAGLMIYQTNSTPGYYYYDGSDWENFGASIDNLGNHTATQNLRLDDNWLSNDGGNKGIRIADNGYVGIGHDSPDYPLVVKELGVNSGVGANNNYLMRIEQQTSANNGGGIIIKGSRNLSQMSSFVDFSNYDSSHGDEYILSRTGGVNESSGEKGAFAIYTNGGGTDDSGLAERMRVTSSGKVGIGVTNPTAMLDVNGQACVRGLAGSGTRMVVTDNSGNLTAQNLPAAGLWSENASNSNIYYSAGKTSVGTTWAFGQLTVSEGGNDPVLVGGGSSTGSEVKFLGWGTNHFSIYNSGDNRLTFARTSSLTQTNSIGSVLGYFKNTGDFIVKSGKVGLGTENPRANLHIYGSGTSGFNPAFGGAGPEIAFSRGGFSKPAATIQMLDFNGYSAGLCFNVHKGVNYGGGGSFSDNWPTDVLQAMTILNNGNVGIGATNPVAKLHVTGDARITDLAGSGTRMVVADANGDLSTQAIPSGGGGSAAYGVNGSSSHSRSSTSFTYVNDMSLTLPAGTYILQYNSEIKSSNSSNRAEIAFYANGGTVSASSRVVEPDNNEEKTVTVTSVVTVNYNQTVRVRFRKYSGSGSVTVGKRCFTAIKM